MSDAVTEIAEQISSNPPKEQPTIENVGDASKDGTSSAPKADDRVSSKLEMLIRREQQAIARERIAKAQEQESLRLRSELDKDRARISDFDSIKSNPKLALEKLGLTYDELTKAILQDGQLPPEVELKKLRGDIDGLRQEKEQDRQNLLEQAKLQAQAQEERAISDFKSEISTYVKDNTARYELINFDEREDEVYELIDAHYTRTQLQDQKRLELEGKDPNQAVGKVMKISEAADKIEEYYEKKELEKKKLSKLQALWGAVPKETLMKAVVAGTEKVKPQTRTLNNNMSATAMKPPSRPKTDDERVSLAIANWRASRGG